MEGTQQLPPNEWNGRPLLIGIFLLPALSLVFVSLRIYTRFFLLRKPAADDYAILLAMALSIGDSVATGFQLIHGASHHVYYLSYQDVMNVLKDVYATIIVYNFALSVIKISILLQYIRICQGDKTARRFCKGGMYLVVAIGTLQTITAIFPCRRVSDFWDIAAPDRKCLEDSAIWLANAIMIIATDFAILLIPPILILRGSKMPTPQKVVVSGILAFGGLACLASILRMHSLWVVKKSNDKTWDSLGVCLWSLIEINVGIMCTAISALRPLVSRLMPGRVHTWFRNFTTPSHVASLNLPTIDSDNTGSKSGREFENV